MDNVEYFDWNLSALNPVSYLLRSHPQGRCSRQPDMHSALHLGFVVSGGQQGIFAGESVDADAGSFYLTAPWEPHYTVRIRAPHQLLLLNIDWESLQNAFFTGRDRLELLMLMPPQERMDFLNRQLRSTASGEELFKIVTQQKDSDEKKLRLWNLILKIFITILPPADQKVTSSGNYQRLLPALKHLSGKLTTTASAAACCNLSSNYFAQMFKKQFGLSFGRYERNFRLNGAAGAVQRGASLKEAADAWGFCDKSHLARLLKKRTGG